VGVILLVADIRPAAVADANAIAALHGRSFLATYPDLSKTIATTTQGLSRRVALWTDRLENPPPGCATFVAHEDLRIHGFVFVGPSGDEDHKDHGISQVFSIHVDPSRWGGGIGKRLLDHALGFLQSSGFKEATLWVVAGNDRARHFYEALGWQLDGMQRKEILAVEGRDGDDVEVVRYRLELNARDEQ
jgi:ribosomal protein S18 acetylase RimI-like enzyme